VKLAGWVRRPVSEGWTAGGVRLFVGLLVAAQVAQGLFDPIAPGNAQFTESYYLVAYHHGFVRRGLLGEVLRLVVGVPTRREVDLVADLVTALAVVSVLVVIELLIRRASPSSVSLAILLAASPFTLDFFIVDRRPDLLAVVLLVALGMVLVRTAEPLLGWLLVFGLGFAALVLIHEDVVLVQLPWAMVLVTVATLGRNRVFVGVSGPGVAKLVTSRLVVLITPSLVAAVAVLAYGMPTARRVAAMQADMSSFRFSGNTVFTYLPDSISTARQLVDAIPHQAKLDTLLLGAILAALQLGWIIRWVTPVLWTPFLRRGNRALGGLVGASVVTATVLLFATGFDWVRWFADCGTAWLIVQGFTTLLDERGPGAGRLGPAGTGNAGDTQGVKPTVDQSERIHLSHWLPALAVYLTLVPPLDVLYISGHLNHFLLW
jgi:hypothetical protein